jgi:hypothetical protein
VCTATDQLPLPTDSTLPAEIADALLVGTSPLLFISRLAAFTLKKKKLNFICLAIHELLLEILGCQCFNFTQDSLQMLFSY